MSLYFEAEGKILVVIHCSWSYGKKLIFSLLGTTAAIVSRLSQLIPFQFVMWAALVALQLHVIAHQSIGIYLHLIVSARFRFDNFHNNTCDLNHGNNRFLEFRDLECWDLA